MDLPSWFYDELTPSTKQNNPTKSINSTQPIKSNNQPIDHKPLTLDMFENMETKPTQEDLDYFNLFSSERLDNTASWIKSGF